jgi:hypothetical protein
VKDITKSSKYSWIVVQRFEEGNPKHHVERVEWNGVCIDGENVITNFDLNIFGQAAAWNMVAICVTTRLGKYRTMKGSIITNHGFCHDEIVQSFEKQRKLTSGSEDTTGGHP